MTDIILFSTQNPRYASSALSQLTSVGMLASNALLVSNCPTLLINVFYFLDNNHLDNSCNCECGGHIFGIAVVAVLLVVAIACIVGLVIWIVQLNKKNMRLQTSKQ